MKILIIEDEKVLSESIAAYLKGEDYLCDIASDFKRAMDMTSDFDYDCILLDITLPGGSGLEILKELKAANKLDGVLIISAKNSIDDKVAGLKLGADDYLPKPFHLSELSARIAAIIRRRNFEGSNLVKFKEIEIDTMARTVSISDTQLELTRKEYELLIYFIINKRRVISKNAIASHVWGDDMDGNMDFIYTHIKNLRKKLQEAGAGDYIRSVYGMGYKFAEQ
ncbi:MAG: response regulator transcription factor [Ferruginibacter sp.]